MSTSDKPAVFISYSHKDEEWKDRLLPPPHLKMLEQAGLGIVVWDDPTIDGGAEWFNEIMHAMARAAVAASDHLTILLRTSVSRKRSPTS